MNAEIEGYTDQLLSVRQDAIGLVQLRAGRSLGDLVPVDGPRGKAGGAAPGKEGRNVDHVCFRVEPFDEPALRAHLASLGIVAGPTESRYGAEGEGPSIYLSDPEGTFFEAVEGFVHGSVGTLIKLIFRLLTREEGAMKFPPEKFLLTTECDATYVSPYEPLP